MNKTNQFRRIDLLEHTLSVIESLEFDLEQNLNPDKSYNLVSLDIKSKIDALRMVVCSELKQSIMRRKGFKKVA